MDGWEPTMELRFIENALGDRILQQRWRKFVTMSVYDQGASRTHRAFTGEFEWRAVPLVFPSDAQPT